VSTLFRFLARLPLSLLHNLGALMGLVAWLASPTYRRNVHTFMGHAGLLPHRWRAIAESGKTIFELPKVWLRPYEEIISRVVKVSGWEVVQQSHDAKRGLIILTPHLGCFEMIAQYLASHRPMTALYRPPKQAWLEPIIREGRGAKVKLAPADMSGVRRLLKALKAGETIGILPDQVPGNGEGAWSSFFGQPAYTMTLAARLTATDADVVFCYAERLPYGAGYHLHFRAPLTPLQGDLNERATQINQEVEALIRECPAQYLWGYNRYKVPRNAGLPGAAN
jgi:Kdo2-lipid IVA lauroyltransferase/acyltransferase